MKALLKIAAWVAVMALLVPQLFVMSYFFPIVVKGVNRLPMLQELAMLGLVISWIAAPFFLVMALLYRGMVALRFRWWAVLLFCVLAGYLLVVAWNHVIFNLFSYGRAALPVLMCSLFSAGYALARDFYFRTLPPEIKKEQLGKETQRREDAKNPSADLP